MYRNTALLKRLALTEGSLLSHILWTFAFAGATAVAARVEIPHDPVPYTLQTFVVLLAGGVLGARRGAVSQALYLVAGVLGAPVFALGHFGLMTVMGPTGGYLLAFPFAAALVGSLTQHYRSFAGVWLSMVAGTLLIFASGMLHLYAFYLHDVRAALVSGFVVFSWWDFIKLTAAAAIVFELRRPKSRE